MRMLGKQNLKGDIIVRILPLATAVALLALNSSAFAQAASQERLFVMSDTDMVPTVYETGLLGPADTNHGDTLSIIASPFDSLKPGLTEVSNSTFGPPGSLDISADGRFAFIAETFLKRPDGAERLDELQQGNLVRSLHIEGTTAREIDSVRIGTQPQAIHLNPAGDLIVAITVDADKELAFVPIKDGTFGEVAAFGLGLEPSTGFIPLKSTWLQWHPSGRYVAVNLVDRGQVAFYEIERTAAGVVTAVRPWGNRVQTNKFPFVGRFTPDGRHYVTSDVQWGVDTAGFYGVRDGILTTVRVAGVGSTGDAARHTVPHIALGGWGGETIAFSPDGRFLVSSNLRGTGKPDGSPDWTEHASISLYELDPETGRLTRHGEYPVAGVLPQGLAFDKTGRSVFVGVNRYRDETVPLGGSVEIWRIETEGATALVNTGRQIRLPAGVHTIVAR